MEAQDILRKCFNLVWYYGDFCGEHDMYEFKDENLVTWDDYDKVERYLKQIQQAVKTLKEVKEFCVTCSDNHDVYEAVYKQILDIISKNEVV